MLLPLPKLGLYRRRLACKSYAPTVNSAAGDLWLLLHTEYDTSPVEKGICSTFLLPNGLVREKFWSINRLIFDDVFEKVDV